jgi:hypothetical protein
MTPRVSSYGTAGVRTGLAALLAGLVAGSIVPTTSEAQAILRGRVVDSETGQALAGATVTIRRGDPPLTSDSLGQFVARQLPSGAMEVRIQLLGYALSDFKIFVPDSGVMERDFSVDYTGQRLPAMVVRARAELLMPRYAAFERRRQQGLGAFFRWDDLAKAEFGSVGDALRTVRGVRIKCNQATFECYAVMARAQQCQPTWFIDGMEARSFNENTPIRDIYGLEVYRGAGEIPGEYAGANAACGVIVMWTKSRPFRVSP